MLPYTPLHHLLLGELGFPVVATSGNLSDEPICTDEQEACSGWAALPTCSWCMTGPSRGTWTTAWPGRARRATAAAPGERLCAAALLLSAEAPTILAVGAHLKNTVALSVGRQVFISQHIGDLETAEALGAFERVIADFLRLYEASRWRSPMTCIRIIFRRMGG